MNDIIKNLRSIASNKQLYTVFEHFVTMTAISLQSSVVSRESERFKILEDEFKSIQQRYNKEENDLSSVAVKPPTSGGGYKATPQSCLHTDGI